MSLLLQASGLRLVAGGRVLADALELTVRAGEAWAVLGANGAGKTHLLRTLAGLRAPEGGEVRLAGRAIGAWGPREAARRRSFLPQAVHDAFPDTVLDIVLAGRHPHLPRWGWEGDAERDVALQCLQAVDLAGFAGRDVRTLSGGERRRAAIAALLAQEAPLMLLDEPVAHLDVQHQHSVLSHLAALAARGRGVVFSVHEPNLAARFATHVALFRGEGRIECGPALEVLDEGALSDAFRHPLARHCVSGRVVFLPW